MGILYAKVGGTFVPIAQSGPMGPSGGPVPVGGALGDLIIKSGAPDFAVRWGFDPPKLQLTFPYTNFNSVAATPALQIGLSNTWNTALYGSGIQQRLNGNADVFRLNYYGGQVIIGGAHTDGNVNMLAIGESNHATSRRAGISFGNNWYVGQDWNANGTKDFYVHSTVINARVFTASVDGKRVEIAADVTGSAIQLGHINDARVIIGNDAALRDIGVAHTMEVRSESDPTRGSLKFGSGGTIHGLGSGVYLHLQSLGSMYYDGDTHYFRNKAGGDFGLMNSSGFGVYGSAYLGFPTYGGGWYMSDATWIRSYGSKNVYCSQISRGYIQEFEYALRIAGSSTGIYAQGTGAMDLMGGGSAVARIQSGVLGLWSNQVIRFYTPDDPNHTLGYSGLTPIGSGEASNGPKLQGYTSVWLYNAVNNKSFFLSSNGNVFINAGCAYNTFSSVEFKDDIESLDPDDCLDQVRRWRPVEYDYRDDEEGFAPARRHGEGFIAEELHEVSPALVTVRGEDQERTGWPYAIDYGQTTPRLAGAIQALANRIEQLERTNA